MGKFRQAAESIVWVSKLDFQTFSIFIFRFKMGINQTKDYVVPEVKVRNKVIITVT